MFLAYLNTKKGSSTKALHERELELTVKEEDTKKLKKKDDVSFPVQQKFQVEEK